MVANQRGSALPGGQGVKKVTVFEHAMLGVTATTAAGLDRRYGWPVVAAAGVVSLLPDWDGLALVFGAAAFDKAHRVWGHSLLTAGLLGAAFMVAAARWRLAQRAVRLVRPVPREEPPAGPPAPAELLVWAVLGVVLSWLHLAADLVYSGHDVLPDWGLQLFWPFSDRSLAFPLVPWGDVGTTLIFVVGMFALVRWPRRSQGVGLATLAAVIAYIVIRGIG
ncbi:MAG TPA: metal-dependent hydrolase [Planctomycetes bacterium]|nr:metal-dependent hydrolase [Planctomycetota bacterium]